jgi:type IX secretion system PorP/SprF family membrane protein
MRLKKILVILFFISTVGYAQHDFLYSQYYFSGILVNPAYAGSQDALNFTSIYRNQWTGLEGAPQNISVGLHSPLKSSRTNAGLIFLSNKFGLTSETKFLGVYAYRIKAGRGSLSFGLQGGVQLDRNSWNKIETTQGSDPVFTDVPERSTHGVFGFGMLYKTEKMFIGLSSPQLYDTRKSFDIAYSPVLLSAGFLLKINDNLKLRPAGFLRYVKNSPPEGDLSAALYTKEIFGIGLGYRSNDAAYAFIDLRLNEQFSLGYCYDYTLSSLSRYSGGSHEFMLRYLFSYKLNTKSPRYF